MQVPETEVIVTGEDGAELLRTMLSPGEYVIGRNTDCELPVISDQVSRTHALLTINFDHALLEDLGSSNGTFIDGQPVKERTRLWPNQRIQLGTTTLELRRTKSPEHKYSLPPGSRLRHYAIVRLLGHGGFALTYLADDTRLHRKVAIKEMLPIDFAIREPDGTSVVARSHQDKDNFEWARQRFVEEGRTLAALQHPSILSIHDIFEEHGTAYLVTAFIEGSTFEELLRERRALSQQELLSITNSLLDALHLVHAQGFLHRDIKPENILIERRTSRPVLIDFGNARIASGQKTASVTAVLTPGYAPMEQYQTRTRQGPSTDVYALGAVLYRAITNTRPDDAIDRLEEDRILTLSRQRVPGYNRRFLATIDKALQMRREDRWTTCEEWKAAILDSDRVLPPPASTPPPADRMLPPTPLLNQTHPNPPPPLLPPPPKPSPARPHPTSENSISPTSPRVRRSVVITLMMLFGVCFAGICISMWNSGKKKAATETSIRFGLPTIPVPKPPAITSATATKDAPFVNTLGMEFVPVLGTNALVCRTDVRVSDWQAFVLEEGDSEQLGITALDENEVKWVVKKDLSWRNPGFAQTPEHPVVGVSWEDAHRFCAWLGKKEDRNYRLPTDAEWSAAVGSEGYPWGSGWPPPEGAGNYCGSESRLQSDASNATTWTTIEGYKDDYPRTSPVGKFKANAFGLYDMGANVWQWCEDEYRATMNDDAGTLELEKYPALKNEKSSNGTPYRVLRGGSWGNADPFTLRSARRHNGTPTYRSVRAGFRCVLLDSQLPSPKPPPDRASTPIIPATATKDAPFVNALGMEFVPVPGTSVLFCRTDARVKDFRRYAGETNYQQHGGIYALKVRHNAEGKPSIPWELDAAASWEHAGFSQTNDDPAVGVSWNEATDFCAWLSRKEGRTYRLPKDEEWLSAAGSEKYPWGTAWPPPKVGNYGDRTFFKSLPGVWPSDLGDYEDGYPRTSPVGRFQANTLGLFDMSGNVWQWCETEYKASMNSSETLQKYPILKDEKAFDGIPYRVVHGGSWDSNDPIVLSSAYRGIGHPMYRSDDYGFRCVLAVSGAVPAVTAEPRPPKPASKILFPVTAPNDAPFVNTLGMEFVPVPGTSVLFCRTDARVKDFRRYAEETNYQQTGGIFVIEVETNVDGSRALRGKMDPTASWKQPGFAQTDDHAVVGVSWLEARNFCAWLSDKEGRKYRLPTDEEWSAAVGSEPYPWGSAWPPPKGVGNFFDRTLLSLLPGKGWTNELQDYNDFYPRTSPVGKFKSNAFGLFDMSGNVWQLCETEYKSSMNNQEVLKRYPHLLVENARDGTAYRVIRGGSWVSREPIGLRSTYRDYSRPTSRADDVGFRCVLVASGVVPSPTGPTNPSGSH